MLSLLIFGSALAPAAAEHSSDMIGKAVTDALARDGSVSVMIMLHVPPSMQDKPTDTVGAREEIARLQDEVLASLEPSDFRLSIRYENVPALAGRLYSSGLAKLEKHPRIQRVDADVGGGGGVPDKRTNN